MRRLFQALSRSRDGAFIMNKNNQIIFWNRAAQTLLGYTADEVAGKLCYEILGGRDDKGRTLCQRYCRIVVSAARGEILPNLDVLARTQSGERLWINVTTFAIREAAPEVGNVIVHLFRDASDKKDNERLLNQILELAAERKNETERSAISMPGTEPVSDPRFDALTPREREVLFLLAQGLGTEQMADMLSISPTTIRNHVHNVLSKLEVHSRLEAVAYAYQQGLIDVSQ